MLEVRKEKEEKKGQEKRSGSISHSPKDYNLIRRTWRNKRHDDNNSHYVSSACCVSGTIMSPLGVI